MLPRLRGQLRFPDGSRLFGPTPVAGLSLTSESWWEIPRREIRPDRPVRQSPVCLLHSQVERRFQGPQFGRNPYCLCWGNFAPVVGGTPLRFPQKCFTFPTRRSSLDGLPSLDTKSGHVPSGRPFRVRSDDGDAPRYCSGRDSRANGGRLAGQDQARESSVRTSRFCDSSRDLRSNHCRPRFKRFVS
jgi:hypothetical protein